MKLIVTRHAETNYNVKGLVNYDPLVDVHLTENGVEQAKALAEQLKDFRFDAIYVSRLKRTRQTAEIINSYHSLELIENELLDDIRNGFEGRTCAEAKKWRNEQADPFTARYLDRFESVSDVSERVKQFLEYLALHHDEDEVILVVTSSHIVKHLRRLNGEITLQELLSKPAKHATYYVFDVPSKHVAKGNDLEEVVKYMKAHWASPVKEEWQVKLEEYPAILERAVAELSVGATRNRQMFRIAGISGSGKTTQILPAVEALCEKKQIRPVLMAARQFVEYHPHYQEIREFYGEENLRKMTDEFVTIMLFFAIVELTQRGFDIVLDVTLLDPKIEAILLKYLTQEKYRLTILMVAVSPKVTERFLAGRKWRHSRETEEEFVRATECALKFYAEKVPETRIVIWSVYQTEPEYDGPVARCLLKFRELSEKDEMPKDDDEARREAKREYLVAKE